MSDFYRDQPEPTTFTKSLLRKANSEWNKAAYANGEGAQSSDGTDPYSAWRRPSGGSGSFLDDDPAPFGPEIQQGGVPLSSADMSDFRMMGDAAPTRSRGLCRWSTAALPCRSRKRRKNFRK